MDEDRKRHASASCALAARDPFVNAGPGIRCVDAGPRHATVDARRCGDAHINFNGTCHGGVIFTLADTAFGLASNSHGVIAAGIDAHITYHVAAQAGDTLIATAIEVSRTRKIAVYRIDVRARRRHAGRELHRHRLRHRRAPTSPRTAGRLPRSPGRGPRQRGPEVAFTCRCRSRARSCGPDSPPRPSPSAAAPGGTSGR